MTFSGLFGCVYLGLFYADPGSGMLLWQLITAAALGLMFYGRTIVQKLWGIIRPADRQKNETSSTE